MRGFSGTPGRLLFALQLRNDLLPGAGLLLLEMRQRVLGPPSGRPLLPAKLLIAAVDDTRAF